LRESGAIEQDADMVMFLYRPEYYGITEDEDHNSTQGVGEVIIAKHRNGSLDTVKLRFIGRFTKFTDLDNFGGQNMGSKEPMYGQNFVSQSSGISQFDAGNTIKLQSRANEDDTDDLMNKGSKPTQF
jgi:replicative DNA helicase